MSSLKIKPLEESDLDAVSAALPARAPEMHRRRLEAQEGGGLVYLIAWFDGEAAGFVCLMMHDDRSPETVVEARGFALVEDLFVEARFRGRGAGRALMRILEERARAAGMPGVILDTGIDEDYAPARALYRSLGYVDQGGVYLGGWSDPDQPGVHYVDPLTLWLKTF